MTDQEEVLKPGPLQRRTSYLRGLGLGVRGLWFREAVPQVGSLTYDLHTKSLILYICKQGVILRQEEQETLILSETGIFKSRESPFKLSCWTFLRGISSQLHCACLVLDSTDAEVLEIDHLGGTLCYRGDLHLELLCLSRGSHSIKRFDNPTSHRLCRLHLTIGFRV